MTAPGIEIARAGPTDLEALVPLFDAYRDFYRRPTDTVAARRFLAARLDGAESVVFLARLGGVPVGFAQLYPLFSSLGLSRLWLLNDLYTAETTRRRGVGRALLGAARHHAGLTGARGLLLQTTVDNLAAQALYERDGWLRQSDYYWYECPLG